MLEIRNIECRYDKVRAVHELSLEVGEGELVTLIGANGAGKTTTLKCVSGLVPASSGRVSFEGEEITNSSASAIL